MPQLSAAAGSLGSVELELLDDTAPAGVFLRHRQVVIVIWRDVPGLLDVTQLTRTLAGLPRGEPFGVLQILKPGSTMPSEEVRRALVKMFVTHAKKLFCLSLVLGESGFWASAARAAVNVMVLAAPARLGLRSMVRVDKSVEDAVTFVSTCQEKVLGRPLEQALLLRAVENAIGRA